MRIEGLEGVNDLTTDSENITRVASNFMHPDRRVEKEGDGLWCFLAKQASSQGLRRARQRSPC